MSDVESGHDGNHGFTLRLAARPGISGVALKCPAHAYRQTDRRTDVSLRVDKLDEGRITKLFGMVRYSQTHPAGGAEAAISRAEAEDSGRGPARVFR